MDLFEHQIVNFIFSIATGLLIGILFDIYRGLWKRYSPPRVTMPFLDTIWWMIVTILVFLAFLWCTWGEVDSIYFWGR